MKVNTNISIDADLKKESQILFKKLHIDFSTAISLFLNQAVIQQGIPFDITLEVPNEETKKAFAELEEMKKHPEEYPSYSTAEEFIQAVSDHIDTYKAGKYEVHRTKAFNKDIDRAVKRGFDTKKLYDVVELLADGKNLPAKYKDHSLMGNYKGMRECHIQNDWVLIYRIDEEEVELLLFRNGTHSDLY